MIAQRTKTLFLWVPTFVLLITVVIVLLLITTNNSQRINRLEDAQNPTVITFTFNQPSGRFRVLCNADHDVPNVYICATTRVGPPSSPSPRPTR